MSVSTQTFLWRFVSAAQFLAMLSVAAVAVGALGLTILMAAGVLPWPVLPLGLSDGRTVNAAPGVLLGLVFLGLLLLVYMPANWRLRALENSHRSFQVGMADVANAYWAAHEADREGIFTLHSEYDSVKERYHFLREHPDLKTLEPEILEMAAEMSHTSRDLALRYSDEAVTRARAFLEERTDEATRLETEISTAATAVRGLRSMVEDLGKVEARQDQKVQAIVDELNAVLPRLGLEPLTPTEPDDPDVIRFATRNQIPAE